MTLPMHVRSAFTPKRSLDHADRIREIVNLVYDNALERHPDGPRQAATYDDVPVEALLPAFLVSELETAFTIGFRMLLPFLVLDILVATLVVATGLVMLPPSLVSLPLKLLVFVAADGWSLVVRSLLDSVRALPS